MTASVKRLLPDPEGGLQPLPGTEPDIWEDLEYAQPYRILYGMNRGVLGLDCIVQTSACQSADGSIYTGDDAPRVCVQFGASDPLSAQQARELAAVLLEAADELDGWLA